MNLLDMFSMTFSRHHDAMTPTTQYASYIGEQRKKFRARLNVISIRLERYTIRI